MRTFLVVLLLTSYSQAGYYFEAQRAIKTEGKPYDATGKCLEYEKSFGELATTQKKNGEHGNSAKEKNVCTILSDKREVMCQLYFYGELFSTKISYWFDSKDFCETGRQKMISNDNTAQAKTKKFSVSYLDYKHENGYESVIGASKNCRKINSAADKINAEIEKIASKEGLLQKEQLCIEDAFPNGYSCKKNEVLSRTYKFFDSEEDCKYKLEQTKKNYNLK